jgi:hypothetical protein
MRYHNYATFMLVGSRISDLGSRISDLGAAPVNSFD